MENKLLKLISKDQAKQLSTSYKENRPLLIHDLLDGFLELKSLPLLESLESLLNIWPREIDVHLPDVCDEISSTKTTSSEALKFHNNKMALLFNDANLQSKVLTDWLEGLRSDMGFSAMTYSRCLIYSTPAGGGTAPHFDQNVNLVLQVHGEKKWWIAKNNHVKNPLTRHTIGTACDPELESYIEEPMPCEMPKDEEEFILKPGSLLFVPRGCWHRTEADADALALNFTFSVPAWLDILSVALRARLTQSDLWRASVDGLNNQSDTISSIENFNLLIQSLADDIPNWNAEQILSMVEGDLQL